MPTKMSEFDKQVVDFANGQITVDAFGNEVVDENHPPRCPLEYLIKPEIRINLTRKSTDLLQEIDRSLKTSDALKIAMLAGAFNGLLTSTNAIESSYNMYNAAQPANIDLLIKALQGADIATAGALRQKIMLALIDYEREPLAYKRGNPEYSERVMWTAIQKTCFR